MWSDILARNHAHQLAPFAGLVESFFVTVAALADAISPTMDVPLSHSWVFRSIPTRFFPCSHDRALAPLIPRAADTVLPNSSLERATVNNRLEATLILTTPRSHHSLYGVGHSSLPRESACLEEAPKKGPLTPSPSPITSLRDSSHLLLNHTHEEFAALAALHEDHTCPPCMDVSGWRSSAPPKYITMFMGDDKALLESKSS